MLPEPAFVNLRLHCCRTAVAAEVRRRVFSANSVPSYRLLTSTAQPNLEHGEFLVIASCCSVSSKGLVMNREQCANPLNTPACGPNAFARLMVVLLSLDLACAAVAHAQLSKAPVPLNPQNKNASTNRMANAWRQAREMKYLPGAWPGAAQPRSSGMNPLVATLNTNHWEWLGPGNIGGRTRSIVVHPTQPGTIWVGGVGGGVWKTTNNAASFFPCDDWMGNLAVSCMALDQTNPNVLYAGTGEGFGNGDAIPGTGVFKSYDGGASWVQLNNFELNNYNINRLAISPSNNRVIVAATSAGIARSTDAGTNWTAPYLSGGILDVAFNPTNGLLCVAGGKNFGIDAALYSTNGGTSWTAASGVATNGRIELAYAPSNPNIVYASQDTNTGTLWVSTNGGVTYTLRNTGSNYLGVQGGYANCIWVDPNSPANLVVGGLDLWRSTDGGATLTKISDWAANEENNGLISVHADHHVIVSTPGFDGVTNTTVFFGNDGGLYCATNIYSVTTNVGWLNLNHNLGITQPYGIAANPTTFATIIGSQDNGSTIWTPTSGTSWTIWGLGDGGFCAADPTDPNYFYGEYLYLQIYRSTNGTLSQDYIYGGIADAGTLEGYAEDDPDAPHNANPIAPFMLDPNNPNTMLAGGSNLWRSVNIKAPTPTWTCITTNNSNPRLDSSFISAIAVTPGDSDLIWIGYNDGVVYQTTNGTGAFPKWMRKSPGSFNACTGLAVDPNNADTVYACFSGFGANNLYRTSDGGTTWTNLSPGLPAAPLHTVVLAPFNSSYVYVGSDLGVFGSADQGVTWSPANEGPANVQVLSLAWARNYLLAGTHGRGAYRIALGPPTVVLTPASLTNYVGSNVSFSASVVGQPALGLQWTYDGKNLAGANSSTLTLPNLQATNSGLYTLWASNSYGTGSGTVKLTVIDPPPYTGLPGVMLTTPADGSSFVALSNILVSASVINNGHTIDQVLFYNSGSLVGQSTTPPYEAILSGATAGPVTLLAQLIYDGSNVISSLPFTINVTNLPPTPLNDIANTVQNTAVTIAVLANDTDPYNLPLTIQSVTRPTRGTAVISGTNLIYTPYDYWFGVDTFEYTVNDGFGATATASVTVTTPFPNFGSTYTNAVLNLGPVAYWRLNETSGATALDSAGGHDGTNNGSLVLGLNGPTAPEFPGFEPTNTAYQFNGTNTSVTFPALDLASTNITITAWLKPSRSQAPSAGIVSWDTNTFWFGFGSSTSFNQNNELNYERNGFSSISRLAVPSNQWSFVALVLGPASNNLTFYLATNSTLIAYPVDLSFYSFMTTVAPLFTNTAFLGDNNGNFFSGTIDEVAIFKKSLTASQLGDLVTAALTGAPAVALVGPTNGSSFNAASNITLIASVITNGNHTIDKVQFYNTNATLVGEVIAPPYTYQWAGMQAGSYSVFARASYDGSGSVDSAPVSLTVTGSVNSVTGTVTGVINPAGNSAITSFSGTPGHLFSVQRSTDLLSWTMILTTNAPASGLFICTDNFSDLGGPPPYAFYRLRWTP